MPKPCLLAPLDTEEWLYSQLQGRAELLYRGDLFWSLGYYPKLTNIGKSWNVDSLLN